MLTIKYTDSSDFEHISEAYDIRAKWDENGRHCKMVSWVDGKGKACSYGYPGTLYVMNDHGSTIAKYIILEEFRMVATCDHPDNPVTIAS